MKPPLKPTPKPKTSKSKTPAKRIRKKPSKPQEDGVTTTISRAEAKRLSEYNPLHNTFAETTLHRIRNQNKARELKKKLPTWAQWAIPIPSEKILLKKFWYSNVSNWVQTDTDRIIQAQKPLQVALAQQKAKTKIILPTQDYHILLQGEETIKKAKIAKENEKTMFTHKASHQNQLDNLHTTAEELGFSEKPPTEEKPKIPLSPEARQKVFQDKLGELILFAKNTEKTDNKEYLNNVLSAGQALASTFLEAQEILKAQNEVISAAKTLCENSYNPGHPPDSQKEHLPIEVRYEDFKALDKSIENLPE